MSGNKTKSQVRPETSIKSIDGIALGLGGKADKTVGLVKICTTSTQPAATNVPAGTLIYNTTTSKLRLCVAGAWVNIN